jgi:hypothetical protein
MSAPEICSDTQEAHVNVKKNIPYQQSKFKKNRPFTMSDYNWFFFFHMFMNGSVANFSLSTDVASEQPNLSVAYTHYVTRFILVTDNIRS